MKTAKSACCKKNPPAWHADFEAMLPVIEEHARISFRHLDRDAYEEAIQETICNAWCAYARLVERGKADVARPSMLPILEHNTLPLKQLIDLTIHLKRVTAVLENAVSSVTNGSRGNNASSSIADRGTFSAMWQGKSCYLGNTISFKLLERLSRRPNQFVHYEVLLQDVWEAQRSQETVCSAVKVLRRKLASAGLGDLAKAIDGSTAHHYRLSLNR